jgi:hypothetical protein
MSSSPRTLSLGRVVAVLFLFLLGALLAALAFSGGTASAGVRLPPASDVPPVERAKITPAPTYISTYTATSVERGTGCTGGAFCNPTIHFIPNVGPATPYPSDITVSGLGGTVADVNVTLNSFDHTWPDDVDMLLVGPGGQTATIMSDAGGGTSVHYLTITLDDQAASPLPDSQALTSGTFQPTDYEPGDPFPAPAPAPSGNVALAVFNGTNPNGIWHLYIVDDSPTFVGYLDNGWCLTIATASCPSPTASPTSPISPTVTSMSTPMSTQTSTVTYTPINTQVPPSATNTRTQTPTATTTPTTCPITFTDVPPGSTFYDHIRCLACRSIVSGYPDGTFRPNNNVTRGQLSKIVSNSAGFSDPPGTQIFQDVAPGSTFYAWVNRLASRGYISGYPCGSPTEPCIPPNNRPYFRPNANVTRGQSSKIVAGAAQLPNPPAGQQTFQDVPEDSTFWRWIESLAGIGAIGGYSCGSPTEPCVPPANRPYFRPNLNVTRGQASKIVANVFFPNCQTP